MSPDDAALAAVMRRFLTADDTHVDLREDGGIMARPRIVLDGNVGLTDGEVAAVRAAIDGGPDAS